MATDVGDGDPLLFNALCGKGLEQVPLGGGVPLARHHLQALARQVLGHVGALALQLGIALQKCLGLLQVRATHHNIDQVLGLLATPLPGRH